MSAPLVLKVKLEQSSLKVINHSLPRDGSNYADDIRKMFPENIQNKIFEYPSKHINKLIQELEIKVKKTLG
jgi:hypothetical protein